MKIGVFLDAPELDEVISALKVHEARLVQESMADESVEMSQRMMATHRVLLLVEDARKGIKWG